MSQIGQHINYAIVATAFVTDSGTAVPAAGVLNIVGGNDIATSGAGSTVTVALTGTTQYAVQVGDATGGIVSLGVATDGQLPIGSTGIAPVLATLTAGIGVGITNAAGSITINAAGVDQSNIIYVGKHGNDGNDGLTIDKAFLTIQAAITAAGANDTVWCFDDGTYTENLTGAADISIYAPNATLSGVHTITDGNTWTFKELLVATAVTGVTLNSAGNDAYLRAERMTIADTGIGILNLAGKIYADIGDVSLVNGFFLGSTTADETYIKFDEIAITGTGTAFGALAGGEVQIFGNCVENSGAGNCTVFYTAGGGAPEINATITHIHSDILSNITAGSDVHLNATALHGALAESGAGTVIVGGATRVDEVPIGAVTPSTGAFTTLSATTPVGVPSGGSGAATFTDHGILLGSGVGAFSVTAVGATNTVLLGNTGADPTWGAVDLATDVTGTLPVGSGGTGVAAITDHALVVGSAAAAVTALAAATDGQIPIGSTGADPVIAAITAGTNITVVNGAGTITINGLGFAWSEVTGTSQAAAVDNGYICNNAGLVTVTLPTTAAVGSIVRVIGLGAGGWRIAQNASEYIRWDESNITTVGTGGRLDSTDDHDAVELICTVADTGWGILSSKGNVTIT